MNMVRGFMTKMGGEDKCKEMKTEMMHAMASGSEEEKKQAWQKFGDTMAKFGEHAKDWKPEAGTEGQGFMPWCGNGDGHSWNSLRAKIVSKPNAVLEACPGTALIEEIEVTNDTFWPWKPGCTLTLHDEQSFDVCPIEPFSIPVEQEVKGKQNLKMSIPLTVMPHITADENKVYVLNLTFRGPKGQAFGEMIPIQLKVMFPAAQVDELEVYKLAIKLHEMNLGSFEECAKAVKDNNCNEANTVKALQRNA